MMKLLPATLFISLLPFGLTACSSEPSAGNEQEAKKTVAGPIGSGPFGIDLTIPTSKLGYDKQSVSPEEGIYGVTVPSPSSSFEHYMVKALPDAGICAVYAASGEFSGDSNGSKVRAAIDAVAAAMETKYGKPAKKDLCNGGDIFCAPENWAMTIMNGDRVYGYQWKNIKAANNVHDITLGVASNNLAVLSFGVQYEVNDMRKCDDAIKANEAKHL